MRDSPLAHEGAVQASGPGVLVRPARVGEMPRIRRLIAFYPEELVQDQIPRIPSFFVAEMEGRLVGCCALQVYSRRLAEVRSLAVHPGHQGRGIATRLVQACMERARERRVRQLLAVTSRPAFFESRGFTVHSGWKTALFATVERTDGDRVGAGKPSARLS